MKTRNAVIPDGSLSCGTTAGKDAGVPGHTTAGKDAGVPGHTTAGKDAGVPGHTTAGRDAGVPGHKGWYSRGYLPHLDQPRSYQAINFRLHDGVPAHVIERWKEELGWLESTHSNTLAANTLHEHIVKYEDAGHGACWLRQPAIAKLVEDALLYFDGARYRQIAWCIMPNHVHTLIETFEGASP